MRVAAEFGEGERLWALRRIHLIDMIWPGAIASKAFNIAFTNGSRVLKLVRPGPDGNNRELVRCKVLLVVFPDPLLAELGIQRVRPGARGCGFGGSLWPFS